MGCHCLLHSRSISPFQCLVNDNYRVSICCTCHFQSSSLLFVSASSVCKSLQCLISALTQGGEGGHMFRFTCSVVLWGGRGTANKYRWCVRRVLRVYGPLRVCHSLRWRVLPRSTLLRLQDALQGHCPKWALCFMHFPGLSHSGSRVPHKSTDWVELCLLCPSQV